MSEIQTVIMCLLIRCLCCQEYDLLSGYSWLGGFISGSWINSTKFESVGLERKAILIDTSNVATKSINLRIASLQALINFICNVASLPIYVCIFLFNNNFNSAVTKFGVIAFNGCNMHYRIIAYTIFRFHPSISERILQISFERANKFA